MKINYGSQGKASCEVLIIVNELYLENHQL